ncbi:MAG: biopolymer transporter ExbD [Candidatus Eisenbacteria bacterium]
MRPGRRTRRKKGAPGGLALTSLVDILTILLIFLLMSFSPEGALLHAAQDLELPESISKEGVTEGDLVLALTEHGVTLGEETVVLEVDLLADGPLLLPGLAAALERASGGDPAGRRILVEGDRRVPFRLLYRVLFTCHQAGFGDLALAAYQREGAAGEGGV